MPLKPKKIPMRMCVSCREMKPKRELLRVVVPAGDNSPAKAVYDTGGKLSGRGAYLCRDAACMKKAQKSRAVERALSCEVDEETWRKLESEVEAHADK